MKKFAFFYLIISIFAFAEVADVSFVLKGGYSPWGNYKETVDGVESKTTVSNSIVAYGELYARSKTFDNFYFGAGAGYLRAGTLGEALLGSTDLGVDYMPIYLIFQYEPESEHYFDYLMYLTLRTGISYERDMGRIKEDAGFSASYSTASPYAGLSWGFEKSGFLIEAFYDFNIGAAANLTELGKTILMQTRRIGFNLGYRFNSAYR